MFQSFPVFNLFENPLFSRIFTVVFSSVAVLGAATGCTFPNLPGINNAEPAIYGVLKKDPTNTQIRTTGFVRANAVRSGDQVNVQALSNVDTIEINQFDTDRLYLLTESKGLFVTENGGREWQRKYIFPVGSNNSNQQQREGEINSQIARNDAFLASDMTFNPSDKNVMYVSGLDQDRLGKIYRTVDGGNSFTQVYSEVTVNTNVTRVVLDPLNNQRVYAVLEQGAIIRSLDSGLNWQRIGSFSEAPLQIGFVPALNNVLFALFPSQGLKISNNDGDTWQSLNLSKAALSGQNSSETEVNRGTFQFGSNNNQNTFREFSAITPVITGNFEQIRERRNGDINNTEWLMIADQQLWVTSGLNQPFSPIQLPLQSSQNPLLAVSYDPKDGSRNLLASIENKLLESNNRGASWSTTDKIQINDNIGSIVNILQDRSNPDIIYLGLGTVRNQRRGLFTL